MAAAGSLLAVARFRTRALLLRARPPRAHARAASCASGSAAARVPSRLGTDARRVASPPSASAFPRDSLAARARAKSTLIPSAVVDDALLAAARDSSPVAMLEHAADRYGGVVVDEASLPPATDAFVAALASSIEAWRAAGVRGVWLKIPTERAELVGPAVHDHGFGFHHAEPTYVMLTRWLPGDAEENHLPPNASHQVGVGAFVTRGDGKVLLVQERRGPAAAATRPDFWKLPTGLVEQGEDIPDAAIREVLEETGVRTEFVSILGIRHGHKIAFGKSDMFFLVALKIADGAEDHAIAIQEQELVAAEWRTMASMGAENAYISPGSHMDHMYGLCQMHAEGKYDGMGWQALPAGFNREGNVTTYSNAPTPDVMAKGTEEGK